MWTEPKTDWRPDDSFYLDPDYRRLCANLAELRLRVRRLCSDPALLPAVDCDSTALPHELFFNSVEHNLEQLYRGSFARREYSSRRLRQNEAVWDWNDLNRIEGIMKQLWADLAAQQLARAQLRFVMGGGELAAYL